jgi:hypothetical protein
MVAYAHAALGDRDAAFDWIERAIRQGDDGVLELRLDPLLASLRSDPRFGQALRELNLPP